MVETQQGVLNMQWSQIQSKTNFKWGKDANINNRSSTRSSGIEMINCDAEQIQWYQTCRMWPSGVTLNRLVSSSCSTNKKLTAKILNVKRKRVFPFYLWDGVDDPWRQNMILQIATVTFRHTGHNALIVTLKNKPDLVTQHDPVYFQVLCQSIQRIVLTISWHHTQCFPAKVLIFLKQTWHLLALQSALIQSWVAFWSKTEAQQKYPVAFSFYSLNTGRSESLCSK